MENNRIECLSIYISIAHSTHFLHSNAHYHHSPIVIVLFQTSLTGVWNLISYWAIVRKLKHQPINHQREEMNRNWSLKFGLFLLSCQNFKDNWMKTLPPVMLNRRRIFFHLPFSVHSNSLKSFSAISPFIHPNKFETMITSAKEEDFGFLLSLFKYEREREKKNSRKKTDKLWIWSG